MTPRISKYTLLLMVVSSVVAETRTWTSTDGREIQAEALSRTETAVTIKRIDGWEGAIPLSMLSAQDREFVKNSDIPIENTELKDLIQEIQQLKPEKGRMSKPGTHVMRVSGRVMQNTPEGVLLAKRWENQTLEPFRDEKGTYHGGANIMNRNLLIVGAPETLVDGDVFKGIVYPAGVYRYESVLGAGRTVHRYATSAELAAKILLSEKEQEEN